MLKDVYLKFKIELLDLTWHATNYGLSLPSSTLAGWLLWIRRGAPVVSCCRKKAFNEERSHNNLIQEDVDEHEIDEIDISSLC